MMVRPVMVVVADTLDDVVAELVDNMDRRFAANTHYDLVNAVLINQLTF